MLTCMGSPVQTLRFSSQVGPDCGAIQARIPELDGLRGIAIAMVLLWHLFFAVIDAPMHSPLAYLQAAGRLAWTGVDLFFVLSGFLIGGILLDHRAASNYFQIFYTRRFFRIVPLYMLCVGIGYVLMALIQQGALPGVRFLAAVEPLPWVPHIFFLQNFWMAARGTGGLLVITWSLAVEEQFYLTLPAVVRSVRPARLLQFVCGVILAAPLIRVILFYAWPGHPWAQFTLLPCRADTLMLGVLGAITIRSPRCRSWLVANRTALRSVLLFLAAGLLFFAKLSFDPLQFGMQMAGYTWIAVFYVCVLLYVLSNRQSWTSRLVSWPPLRWLGTLAYGLYLSHMLVAWAIFGFLYSHHPRVADLASAGASALALLVTVILCQVSWVYFEKPLLKLGHHIDYEFGPPANAVPFALSAPQRTSG
jgi:peptidoglycan/LPS O-acetylase OafA/YrhL